MKKIFIITTILVVMSFTIGFMLGDSTATDRENKQLITNNQQTITTNNIKNTQQSNDTSSSQQKNNDEKICKFGEEGISGYWNLKVSETKEDTVIKGGNSSDTKTTQEKFIIIKLQIKNITKTPIQYSTNEFILENGKTQEKFNPHFDASQIANNKETIYNKNDTFVGVYTDTNPNMIKQTYVIFEVPKDMNVEDLILINSNNNFPSTKFYLK